MSGRGAPHVLGITRCDLFADWLNFVFDLASRLSGTQCKAAKDADVLVAINSDAHSTRDFAHLRFGVGQARRGWIEASDVLNAQPLAQLTRFLTKLGA